MKFVTKDGQPIVVSYGGGLDSTAELVGFWRLGIRPDAILFADTGSERRETYRYLPIMNDFLKRHRFPAITVVRYEPKRFMHWPPYKSLEENCLSNATLPSLAFRRKSCSLKWKAAPMDKWVESWPVALKCWERGARVLRLIGYDAGPKDARRCNHAGDRDDERYEYRYPLIEWGWTRERCAEVVAEVGLPVPVKSSCFFCPAMKVEEVRTLPTDMLRRIVLMETRAMPGLKKIGGLWGRKRKRDGRPASMTAFIRNEGLLPAAEVDAIVESAPLAKVLTADATTHPDAVPSWQAWLAKLMGGTK